MENANKKEENGKKPWTRAPRFGIEKPAIPGPGRPPLSEAVKVERKAIREALESISPRAIERLSKAIESKDERNAIRAAEAILSKTVPDLSELEVNKNEFENLSTEQFEKLFGAISARAVATNGNGSRVEKDA